MPRLAPAPTDHERELRVAARARLPPSVCHDDRTTPCRQAAKEGYRYSAKYRPRAGLPSAFSWAWAALQPVLGLGSMRGLSSQIAEDCRSSRLTQALDVGTRPTALAAVVRACSDRRSRSISGRPSSLAGTSSVADVSMRPGGPLEFGRWWASPRSPQVPADLAREYHADIARSSRQFRVPPVLRAGSCSKALRVVTLVPTA